ncbi:hypothetical protein D6C79_07444 [Aureobasidium pullulans]|nr:hypothetical protein D6C79_07444 [Aureobasidium pullulans]
MDSLSSPSCIPLDESSICIHFPQSSPLVQRPHISQLFAISPRIAHQSPDLILTGTMTIQMEDILANRVPTPWTYASFVAYLSDNYCLEILQFALAAAQYKERYDFISSIPGRRVSLPSQESQDLLILWTSLVETYLLPDGEREVNLPSQIRDPIIGYTLEQRAADPQVLDHVSLERLSPLVVLKEQKSTPGMNEAAVREWRTSCTAPGHEFARSSSHSSISSPGIMCLALGNMQEGLPISHEGIGMQFIRSAPHCM